MTSEKKIAFQGELGAYSHIACNTYYPDYEVLPCPRFEQLFAALHNGDAALAMTPIENNFAGRVADVHRLLPGSGLYIIAEHFAAIHHCLMAKPDTVLSDITLVKSHEMALAQCRKFLSVHDKPSAITTDTAGAAREIHENDEPYHAAIASSLAADIHGLKILAENIEDAASNTTRFLVMSRTADDAELSDGAVMTSLIFRLRNVPAALYKALGGFATNGVNMTKLESYYSDGHFSTTQFYADIEGHPDDERVRLAIEDLSYYSTAVDILGVYKASPFRKGTD